MRFLRSPPETINTPTATTTTTTPVRRSIISFHCAPGVNNDNSDLTKTESDVIEFRISIEYDVTLQACHPVIILYVTSNERNRIIERTSCFHPSSLALGMTRHSGTNNKPLPRLLKSRTAYYEQMCGKMQRSKITNKCVVFNCIDIIGHNNRY